MNNLEEWFGFVAGILLIILIGGFLALLMWIF
jgi:hypothetical protein